MAVPKEIIVIDDGSVDGTREFLKDRIAPKVDRVILQEKNQGKGAALRTGFQAATGDFVIVQDADLEYDPQDVPRLLPPILDGRADVVYGSRFSDMSSLKGYRFWHSFGNRFLTRFSNLVTGLSLTDMETCYKLFKREIIQSIPIRENRFGFEPEITAKIARRGCRVHEVAISYDPRTYAEGKKIGWKDGLRALWCILKYRWAA